MLQVEHVIDDDRRIQLARIWAPSSHRLLLG